MDEDTFRMKWSDRIVDSTLPLTSHPQAMLGDASTARDTARADLTKLEQDTHSARHAREQEKKRLQTLAEERRRQYEAMEKRLRLASVGEEKEEAGAWESEGE